MTDEEMKAICEEIWPGDWGIESQVCISVKFQLWFWCDNVLLFENKLGYDNYVLFDNIGYSMWVCGPPSVNIFLSDPHCFDKARKFIEENIK